MRANRISAVLGTAVLAASVSVWLGVVAGPARVHAAQAGATAELRNANGDAVGIATFVQAENKVLVRVTVRNLPPGFHGLHIHSVGVCDAPFTSASSHFNPNGQAHPNHAGDLPVLLVTADGTGEISTVTDRFKVEDLFDADGSAVVIHAGPDNYGNIPHDRYDPDPDGSTTATGDAGGRLVCGIITRG